LDLLAARDAMTGARDESDEHSEFEQVEQLGSVATGSCCRGGGGVRSVGTGAGGSDDY
jgi:hypothetical protein